MNLDAASLLGVTMISLTFINAVLCCALVQGLDVRSAEFSEQCIQTNAESVYKRSAMACGMECLERQEDCKGFVYDPNSHRCTIAEDGGFSFCTRHPQGSKLLSYIKGITCLFHKQNNLGNHIAFIILCTPKHIHKMYFCLQLVIYLYHARGTCTK